MRYFVVAGLAAFSLNTSATASESTVAMTEFVGEPLVVTVDGEGRDDRFDLPLNSNEQLVAKRTSLLAQQQEYSELKQEIDRLTLTLSFDGAEDAATTERIRQLLLRSNELLGNVEATEADFVSTKDLFVADSGLAESEPLAAQMGK